MPRNYSLTSIKMLFAEAVACAFPGCDQPLVFHDRGRSSVVAEIAHIRSESQQGPRFDETYFGDINGVDNLLLLCGLHHRPVDRHESVYGTDELIAWKATQRSTARDGGTQLPASELHKFLRLTAEERNALAATARLADKLGRACIKVHDSVVNIRDQAEQARLQYVARMGVVFEVQDDGTRTPMSSSNFYLSEMERSQFKDREHQLLLDSGGVLDSALVDLGGELAVLRMMSPSLDTSLGRVEAAALQSIEFVSRQDLFPDAIAALRSSITALWASANEGAETEQ